MNKLNKLFLLSTVFMLSIGFTGCSDNDDNNPTLSDKDKVVALLKSIETGDAEPIAYINPNKYIQHNLTIADGLAGFGAFLGTLPEGTSKVNTVRAFQDGNYVFTHTDYYLGGAIIGFDIFRFENGLIVEHWDNLQTKPETNNPSGHSMIDGATEITDLDKTVENKVLVEQFVKDVLMGQNPDNLTSYFDGDTYIQHNPSIADGLSGLGDALAWMAENGITMVYDRIHKVLGEGNFVLVISEGSFAGEHTSFYDLFRVSNGKITEHWDVIETIIPESEWKNQNGKFGF